nr:LysE family transporter [Planosporangium mesophilum]
MLATLSGLGLGLSLIVAIGAQNAFVLRQGLRGEHVLTVVTVCALSDIVLIAAGVAGAGAALKAAPWTVTAVRVVGGLFLLGYAALAARRALRPAGDTALVPTEQSGRAFPAVGLAAILATTLALTWLNPHVYLDTVVLLGSIAGSHGAERWWFAVGAAIASTVWFGALGFGAALLRPVFARPRAWRVLDSVIAAVMTVLAVSMLAGA